MGNTYEAPVLDVWFLTPTAESWRQGDREIVCRATDMPGLELTTAVRHSGL